MAKSDFTVNFQFIGDQFPHAWYFNRYRCDPLGKGILVTTALLTKGGGTPAVNGFVISHRDLAMAKERSTRYFEQLTAEFDAEDEAASELLVAPSRVYPINHINLSRIDDVAEMGMYRFAMHTLLNAPKKAAEKPGKLPTVAQPVPCYPVVMFRSDVSVQVALLKDLFSL